MPNPLKQNTIVEGLYKAYRQDLDLIPSEFRERMRRVYGPMLTDEQVRLMTVRNYIAGMTDSFATEQHKRLYMSSERAGFL